MSTQLHILTTMTFMMKKRKESNCKNHQGNVQTWKREKFFQINNKTRNLKVFKLRYYVINQTRYRTPINKLEVFDQKTLGLYD